MEKSSKIFVAGHNGLVGSAIVRELQKSGYTNILTESRTNLNLQDKRQVTDFFSKERPDFVFLAAAKVGGIKANSSFPVEFLFDNLDIEMNVIKASFEYKVKKLLFLGSSCIYPKMARQPIEESELLSGYLEPTNDAYAIAKIAGIKMCEAYRDEYGANFISAMPTNLYGINDNFDENSSHVLPALLQRFHKAKIYGKSEVVCWGSGSPMREFLYVDDLAEACVFLMNTYDGRKIVNIGTGVDITIKDLTELVAKTVGYEGNIVWDNSKPDGTPRKLLNVSKIHSLGWKHKTNLEEGLEKTYDWYVSNH